MLLVDLDKLKAEFSRVVWVHDVDGDIANGLLARADAVDIDGAINSFDYTEVLDYLLDVFKGGRA